MISTYFIVVAATAILCCSTAAQDTETRCGVNETISSCGSRCEERCNAKKPDFCKTIVCLGHGCACKNGYARNPETSLCVKVEDCPCNRCAPGEILGACGRTCEGTCRKPFEPEVCQRLDCQGAFCRCDLHGGYVRNERTKKCVRKEKCPKC